MRATAYLLASLVLAGPQFAAADELMDATDPETVAEIVRGFGSARISKAADDTPMINGRIDGTRFAVYFYECNEKKVACRSVSFSAAWATSGVTLEAVNEWNRASRFGRAYLDTDGEPVLEYDVNLFGSVTETNFEDSVDWWRIVLQSFEQVVADASPSDGVPSDDDEEDEADRTAIEL